MLRYRCVCASGSGACRLFRIVLRRFDLGFSISDIAELRVGARRPCAPRRRRARRPSPPASGEEKGPPPRRSTRYRSAHQAEPQVQWPMQKQGRGGISSDPVSRHTEQRLIFILHSFRRRLSLLVRFRASRLGTKALSGASPSHLVSRGRRLGFLRPRSCVSRKEAPKVLSARRAWSTSCLWPL